MNCAEEKNRGFRRLYPYFWLAAFAVQIFLLYDIFGLIRAVVLFAVVTGLQIRYKLAERCIRKHSFISIITALFLALMIIIPLQVYPYWLIASRTENVWIKVVLVIFEMISIGMFIHPVVNLIVVNIVCDKEFSLKKLGTSMIFVTPFYFIMFIYLPCEGFLHNVSDFNFPFQSFILYELYYFIAFSLVTSLLLSFSTKAVYRILTSVVLGIDICCYIQYMFLNSKLHLLDGESMKWEEYTGYSVITLIIWLVVISACVIFGLKKTVIFNKISAGISGILIAVQALSVCIMLVMADSKIYSKELEYMSGEEQYTVSGSKNIIMFILDATDNDYFKEILEENPEAFEGYEDFTFYTDTCSVFDSTPTSITQMLTGMDFSVELNGEDWYRSAWKSEKTSEFFDRFHGDNYIINGFNVLYADQMLYNGKFDNCQKMNASEFKTKTDIDSKGLADEFTKLSLYRMLPFAWKKYVDYEMINFNVHVVAENDSDYYNDDFSGNMILEKSKSDKNYLIIEHLNGTHPPCSDFTGESEKLLDMIRNYMNQLKELGVYNDASIIITSDHGRHNDSEPDLAGTPIFMIKRSNTTGSELKISDVPVYHEDIQATLLDCAGLYEQNEDEQIFGRSVFDLKEGELRERTWYDRRYDSDFKSVKTLGSVQFAWSGCNTYYGYSYIGNTDVLADMVSSGNVTNIYQMTDNKG